VEAALAARVGQLDLLASEVGGATHLASSDRSTLMSDLDGLELPGIESLETQVPGATTCTALRAIAHNMIFSYRVYLLVTPQTHLTIVADHEAYTDGALSSSLPAIAQSIKAGEKQGARSSASKANVAQAEQEVSAAQTALSGVAATLLEQSPPQYPGDAPILSSAQSAEASARGHLNSAVKDLGHH